MNDWRLAVMKTRNRFAHVAEDCQHITLLESDLNLFVHQLENVSFVKRHEQEDFVDSVADMRDAGINVSDDVLVPVQSRDNLDLPPARCQVHF